MPTTVFTPLEYGAIGYSEEAAIEKFGEENLEVYHTNMTPLEYTVAQREPNSCYAKIICNKLDNVRKMATNSPLRHSVIQFEPLLTTDAIQCLALNEAKRFLSSFTLI